MEVEKPKITPPFANYDLVVYFGCGLFALPLIFHYIIEPFSLRFPRFSFGIEDKFASGAVSTLSVLFAVYLLGHIIAFLSSAFIERSVNAVCGKVSSAILIAHLVDEKHFNETIQAWVGRRIYDKLVKNAKLLHWLRFLFYVPVAPMLIVGFFFRMFEVFKTRIPPRVFQQIRQTAKSRGYGIIGLRTKWYKAIEHDVMNNHPVATARMYNYLVIAGLFRSLALIFVACAWAELIYPIANWLGAGLTVKGIMTDSQSSHHFLITFAAFNFLSGFCLSAYVKFSRRYAEEALFSFVLTRRP